MVNSQETGIIIDFFNKLCKTKNAGKYCNSDKMFKCASGRQIMNLRAKLISNDFKNKCEFIDLTRKKVVFFDLDNTLIIQNELHETRAIQLLNQLAEKGKILVLITYNQRPENRLSRYNFDKGLFARIYQPELVKNKDGKVIYVEYPPKSTSISSFLEEHNILKDDAIFFDDLFTNIIGVRCIGVESVLVDYQVGIPFDKVIF